MAVRLKKRYEKGDRGGLYGFLSLDGGFTADLPVDADRLVVDYPGLSRRASQDGGGHPILTGASQFRLTPEASRRAATFSPVVCPQETARVARGEFPTGTTYSRMKEAIDIGGRESSCGRGGQPYGIAIAVDR